MKTFLFAVSLLIGTSLFAQTIAEIQGSQAASPYFESVVTTSGIVTAAFSDGFFIQDGNGPWSAIYVYNPGGDVPVLGDEVSVTGTVDEYYEMTELKSVTDLQILSSGNPLPEPELLTSGAVSDEGFESVLVRVEGAVCTNDDLGYGEFELDDGSGPIAVDDMMYLYSAQLGLTYTVTGPLFYSFGAYKIEVRDADDVVNASPLYFVDTPEEFNLTTSSIDIVWTTNVASNTVLEWGQTPDYELFTITNEDMVAEHTVNLAGLQPGRLYYIRAHSEDGENSTTLFERVVCTVSESSGQINVYFNHPVNTAVATTSEATYDNDIVSTIISYINLAQSSLDITMYDTNGCPQSIFDAINTAYSNGVVVRFITDEELENVELDWLDSGIEVMANNFVGIMHDKFIVIDAEDTENAWVMTGSMNWTGANLGWDYNNLICVQDESLAKAYTLEFVEMWGSTTASSNILVAAFGQFKVDNTPHKFIIGDSDAELYFSPSDGTADHLESLLYGTQDNLAFAVMAFTENSLGSAVAAAAGQGVAAEGIIDYVGFNGSEFDYLLGQGVDVVDYQNADGSEWPDGPVLHHKYAIGDFMPGSANPWVATGSHNWTASAGSINDENTLIIYNHEVANWYYQEYTQRRYDLTGVSEIEALSFQLYPNPTDGLVTLIADGRGVWSVFDGLGSVVLSGSIRASQEQLDFSALSSGVYMLRLTTDRGAATGAFVVR